jgi:FtsP/CotA-like multicopper oxidase with cupredoxin domain
MSPMSFMMYTTHVVGNTWQANGDTSFYSVAMAAGNQVNAGTTTVYLWLSCSSSKTINLTLYGGTTSLGTTAWVVNTGGATQLLSTSFSTSAYTFAAGERLQLLIDLTTPFGGYIYWDGATRSESRVVVP